MDIVDGRVDCGGITMMKDISLKGLSDVPMEKVVNKLQDFSWDDVLSEHCQLPEVCIVSHIYHQNQNHSLTAIIYINLITVLLPPP